jgi:hypothetical protein
MIAALVLPDSISLLSPPITADLSAQAKCE